MKPLSRHEPLPSLGRGTGTLLPTVTTALGDTAGKQGSLSQSVARLELRIRVYFPSAPLFHPPCPSFLSLLLPFLVMGRDQLNSRFHGRDIFREIDLLP